PYEENFTLIGTTEVELPGDPGDTRVGDDEVVYLCEQASRYFTRPVKPSDVVWSYAGVRPLLDDASGDISAVTRDYMLESNTEAAPLLTVWGGKITTFRKLAEEAAGAIGRLLGDERAAWTASAVLPGGDLSAWTGMPPGTPAEDFERFVAALERRHAWLPPPLAHRLARAYGTRATSWLADARCLDDLGPEITPGLHAAELVHLQREEWTLTADDVLWRRSKLGLHLDAGQRETVAEWFAASGSA
ncbi:MAG: glycerol-3-phosphate dehydrogenase C-terminal domain-containing protein, partial [Methylibium sp.]|nr:glycerol-3-phosphate dehydrogenase C-terminal domain-containing protein [Methylibium sp.]